MAVYGIDVSSYQEEHYPTTVGGHPVSFAIVKATEGTSYVNPRMNGQAAWGRSRGHVLGFYHFLRDGDMKAQAKYFVEKCASREGDILVADWEDPSVSCAEKDTFLKEVKRLRPTHRVMLYCNVDYWLNRDTTSYAADGLWIAQYNGKPAKPSIRAAWRIHQYTSTPVDTNIAGFASKAAMKAWAEGLMKSGPAKTTTPEKSGDATMDLQTKVKLPDWVPTAWPEDKGLSDKYITTNTALGSSYGHSRAAHEGVDALRAEVKDLKASIAAILAAVTE